MESAKCGTTVDTPLVTLEGIQACYAYYSDVNLWKLFVRPIAVLVQYPCEVTRFGCSGFRYYGALHNKLYHIYIYALLTRMANRQKCDKHNFNKMASEVIRLIELYISLSQYLYIYI